MGGCGSKEALKPRIKNAIQQKLKEINECYPGTQNSLLINEEGKLL
jgi:hypothetical protein